MFSDMGHSFTSDAEHASVACLYPVGILEAFQMYAWHVL